MKKKQNSKIKKKQCLLLVPIILILFFTALFINSSQGEDLSIEWVKIEETSVEQYKIYLKNKNGKYVDGKVEITTIAGDTFDEEITEKGSKNIYIKTVIKDVRIKK